MPGTALLSICIPTFNRAQYLDQCLARLVAEIESLEVPLRQQVKLLVSDNGSTDHTAKIIEKYAAMPVLPMRALFSDVNRGMDFNFSRCYEGSDTPYAWLLGDDDVILPGGIRAVLEAVAAQTVDILYLNHYWFKDRYTDRPIVGKRRGVRTYEDREEFARRVNIMLTFLSAVVVRTGIGAEYRNRIHNSNLIQLSWVLPLLRDGRQFAVIESWTLAALGGNTSGYGLIDVFGKNLCVILQLILPPGSRLSKTMVNGVLIYFFPGLISNLRNGQGKFQSEVDWRGTMRSLYGGNWRFDVFILPLTVLPGVLACGYYFCLKAIRWLFGNRLL